MDIIEILFPIVAAVLYFYFVGRKKSKESVPPPPVQSYDFETEDYDFDEPPNYTSPIDVLGKKESNYPKKEQFVNYDELTQENWHDDILPMEQAQTTSYSFDNERENELDISMELEDIRRGIIYAEILKSPCN